ncbi:hypothetical protein KFL_000920010 [Klebsormidium nitens]|uniref:RRM domain-containing protein n=1 Tax=Klebsormidium nitens TaxID=105231 RepID=A0A0U9HJ32_KLENI|nr:hypothetical protein KFL_000920010 [Klebsormidium nitens]|eukprot:GAQ81816.1 hypothetical protein KFL_000920010 [Klebsormidium nitens]
MGESRSPSPAGSPPMVHPKDIDLESSPPRDPSPPPRDRSPEPRRESPNVREDRDVERSPRRERSHTRSPVRRPRDPSRSVTPVRHSSPPPRRARERSRERSRERYRERSPERSRYRSPDRDRRRDYDRSDRGRSRSRERGRTSDRNRGKGAYRPGNTVFVAGFNFITTEKDLDRKFSKYGRVVDVRIVKDRRNGESKGFGFVTMETDEDADEAVDKLDQTTWNGRVVLVEKAKSDKR